jgi:hypothetical protein
MKIGDVVRITAEWGDVYGQGGMNIAGKSGIIINIHHYSLTFEILIDETIQLLSHVYVESL